MPVRRLAFSALVFALVSFGGPARAQGRGDRIAGRPFASRSPVLARHGMVATSQPLASQAGLQILHAGGSAVDAAIAANAVLALTEPTGCGLGGDLFAIVWDPEAKRLHGYNGSGRSPAGLDLATLRAAVGAASGGGVARIPLFGPLPVTVPGAVDGWTALHERFGILPLPQVLAPAIRLAKEGFPLTQTIAHYWAMNRARLRAAPAVNGQLANFEKTFYPGGAAPAEGDVFRNPDLARTLELIARHGRAGFYGGELAGRIDAYCRGVGCALRKADLAAHRGEWVEPISAGYRGVRVHELPPNGQGLAALQMLRILEGYELGIMGHNSAPYLHAHIEAKKLAFADRARFYADPAFAPAPVQGLLSDAYTAGRRARIDPKRAAIQVSAGAPPPDEGDTIYLATADSKRMMVSLIQSNYVGMGSGLVPDGSGFVLQDRGALFTLEEGHPNVYAPKKRPFHTIIPAFATRDGKPWLSFGVMGGSMQPQGHAQIICNLIDFRMNVQEAGDAARYNHGGSSQPTGEVMRDGGTVALETGIPLQVRDELRRFGHRVTTRGSFGGYQAILFDARRGVYHGASEMRKDGCAIGY